MQYWISQFLQPLGHEMKINCYSAKHPGEIGQEHINYLGETRRRGECMWVQV